MTYAPAIPTTPMEDRPEASTFEDGQQWNVELEDGTIVHFIVRDGSWVKRDEEFGAVHTERIGTEHHYAGAYDGADADARLDTALSHVSDGDILYLENSTYTADRTAISQILCIKGTGLSAYGTTIDANWTFSSRAELADIADIATDRTITFEGTLSVFKSSFLRANVNVVVDDNRFRAVEISGGSLTFNSGTADGIIDASQGVSVTDNGTNTVGDIA